MDKCPEDISGSGTQSLTSRFELLPEIGLSSPILSDFLCSYSVELYGVT